jgi:pyruvate dehydrogenase E2 component (dihydrolipoamide acetyltransferase)
MGDAADAMPDIDFAEFGGTETVRLSNIQVLTGQFLSRSWRTIPHVTHHDNIDVTGMEGARREWNSTHPEARLTPLVLMTKAMVAALRAHPRFNASFDASGKALILKKYFNVGIAVDTPKGLLVPVLRDCDRKSLAAIATELAAVAHKARTKYLSLPEMSGGCISISSLGHIGGTMFTPIINAPEVAILGITRGFRQPVQGDDGALAWRDMLPLSLSYDHRVINGAEAAQFLKTIEAELQQTRSWLASAI